MNRKKCVWFEQNLDNCRWKCDKGSNYCYKHNYVNNYTDEMKLKPISCAGECGLIVTQIVSEDNSCVRCIRDVERNNKWNLEKLPCIICEENKELTYVAKETDNICFCCNRYFRNVSERTGEYENTIGENYYVISAKYMLRKYKNDLRHITVDNGWCNKDIDRERVRERSMEIVFGKCFFCGHVGDYVEPNVIFFDVNTSGYNQNNRKLDDAYSCCILCRDIKDARDDVMFVCAIEHIFTYNKIVNGVLNSTLFMDFINRTSVEQEFNRLMEFAGESDVKFGLSFDHFVAVTKNPCCLCGKKASSTNRNNVDTIDDKEYTSLNCKAFCITCYYFKEYDFKVVLLKMMDIYNNHNDVVIDRKQVNRMYKQICKMKMNWRL